MSAIARVVVERRSTAIASSPGPRRSTPVTNGSAAERRRAARSPSSTRSRRPWRPSATSSSTEPWSDELALVHDRDVVRDLLDLVEQVRRDEDRPAVLLDERADHLAEGGHARRVEAVRRLVEDQQLRVVEEAARDAEPLPHPHRVRLHLPVGVRREADALERRVDPAAGVAAEEARPRPRGSPGRRGTGRSAAPRRSRRRGRARAATPLGIGCPRTSIVPLE